MRNAKANPIEQSAKTPNVDYRGRWSIKMKAKMISFCTEQFNQLTPMFDNLHEALNRAQGTNATFISWGKDYYHCEEGWLMQTINCEKVLAKAASTILRNSLPILEKAGYAGLPMEEAIEWFESRYSLYPKTKPELYMVGRSNELCHKKIEQSMEIQEVRRFAFDCFDKSEIYIVSHFLSSRYANEHLQDEIQQIIQIIEEEIDRHIK